jgi:alpha-L-fucosidase
MKSIIINTLIASSLICGASHHQAVASELSPSIVEKALADPVAAHLAKPTPGQIEWADRECEMFVHFGVATWKGQEYDSNGKMDLSQMNPKGFNAEQICEVAKSWGAKQVILVCKHVGGFCWWPTETTDYCVKSIPWKEGKGNLVKDVADALRKHDLKMGIYIYSDDTRYASGIGRGGRTDDPKKQEEWSAKLRQQWTEVLTICGPDLVREAWFDGGCIVPLKDILDKLAPKAEIFAGPNETVRWPSTESGKLPYPCWSSVPINCQSASGGNVAAVGDPDGAKWCPPECDTVLYGRGGHNWFWSASNESRRHTVDSLMDIYLKSVGRGGVLLLNSTPNTDGAIPEGDVQVYRAFGAEIKRRFDRPLAKTAGVGEMVELDLDGLKRVNQYWIMEDLRGGHRIRAYTLEGRTADGNWKSLATGISVGHKRIDVFPETMVDKLRLRVTQKVGTPMIRELAAFYVDGGKAETALTPPAPVAVSSCGKWAAGTTRVTLDLSPYIKMPATYEVKLVSAGTVTIHSAKLFFTGSELPADDCQIQGSKVTVRQTQQVTAQTKTELVVEFGPNTDAGEATIHMISER